LKTPHGKKLVGKISHYYTKIGVGVIELCDELNVGARISIEGATTNFQQTVDSMQIEYKNVEKAGAGQSVGLKIEEKARQGDLVYTVPTEKNLVGKITHYFSKVGVGVVELCDPLKVGDRISVEGMTTNFQQTVDSMQIEHKNIDSAEPGQSVGLKLEQRTREGDLVYKAI
jgi:putative protease